MNQLDVTLKVGVFDGFVAMRTLGFRVFILDVLVKLFLRFKAFNARRAFERQLCVITSNVPFQSSQRQKPFVADFTAQVLGHLFAGFSSFFVRAARFLYFRFAELFGRFHRYCIPFEGGFR